MKKSAEKPSKKALIVARYQFKANGHVVYAVRASDGKDQYCTTVINGKATGCTCPSKRACYHMRDCQELEAARAGKQPVAQPATTEEALAVKEAEQVLKETRKPAIPQSTHPVAGVRAIENEMWARGLMRK